MSDLIDQGCEAEEADRTRCLKEQARKAKAVRLQPYGFCYNCDELIKTGCFCDTDCRDDFDKREKQLKQRV